MPVSLTELVPWMLVVPALVGGTITATLAFLLSRWKRNRVLGAFAWLTVGFTAFGASDAMQEYGGLVEEAQLVLNVIEGLLIGALVVLLTRFVAQLTSRPWPVPLKYLYWFPLMIAGTVPFFLAWGQPWPGESWRAMALTLLVVLFSVALVCAARLFRHWKQIHDRLMRRVILGTALLFVAFVPVWVWDAVSPERLWSFMGFFLVWNVGSLVLATRTFFEPSEPGAQADLFSSSQLAACAARFGLSPREAEVADLHAQGLSAQDIGDRLFISAKTVRNHITNLYTKTGTGHRGRLLALLRSLH